MYPTLSYSILILASRNEHAFVLVRIGNLCSASKQQSYTRRGGQSVNLEISGKICCLLRDKSDFNQYDR